MHQYMCPNIVPKGRLSKYYLFIVLVNFFLHLMENTSDSKWKVFFKWREGYTSSVSIL